MNQRFEDFDLIFFFFLALFIIYRLLSVLGTRVGADIQSASNKEQSKKNTSPSISVADKILELKKMLPEFEAEGFLQGAKIAFERVFNAFISGDISSIRPFVDRSLLENLQSTIDQRKQAGHVCEDVLLRIQSADIMDLEINRSKIKALVRIISDQIHTTVDSNGNVIEGDANQIEVMTDIWTFVSDRKHNDHTRWNLTAITPN